MKIMVEVVTVGRKEIEVPDDATSTQIHEAVDAASARVLSPMLALNKTHEDEFTKEGILIDWVYTEGRDEDGEVIASLHPDDVFDTLAE